MNQEYHISNLKGKYYYNNFEYYMSFNILIDLLLGILIGVGHDIFFTHHLDFLDIFLILAVIPIIYILFCAYKLYRRGKVKLEIRNEKILIYRLYLLSPYKINIDQVININVRETKKKTIVYIRTTKRKYTVKIYNVTNDH